MTKTDDIYTHLPASWTRAVSLALRLRGANGACVGEALALADAHCADSGQSAHDAFGTPQEYADSVRIPADQQEPAGLMAGLDHAVPSLIGLCGMTLAFAAHGAWGEKGVDLPLGVPLSVLLIMATAVLLVWRGDLFLRSIWAGALLLAAGLFGSVALMIWLTEPSLTLPMPLAVGLSITLLAVTSIWRWRQRGAVGQVIDPLRGDSDPRGTRLAAGFMILGFPVMTAIGIGLLEIIRRATA